MRAISLFRGTLAGMMVTVLLHNCQDPESKPVPDSLNTFIQQVQHERQQSGNNTPVDTANFWYKNAFIYTLDVETFQDSDGDGTGDLRGLISRLDYIKTLGADAIWLAPFQPSPNQDDGYDITDFYSVDPRLGTAHDFDSLVAEARKRGLRIMMDLVINHTSDQHPWFKQAQDTLSPYHPWYVWSKKKPDNINVGMVFPGIQQSIWTWESRVGAYYYHRFYQFQPDLNMQYPAVWTESKRITDYWMKKGIYGFRLDAVPFIIEVPKTKGEIFEHQFPLLAEMRKVIETNQPAGVILGEANVMPEETKDFFGPNGERMNMMFNFYVNQFLFYAFASGQVSDLRKALEQTRTKPAQSQWAQFLRNHDEIDLGRLTGKQRNEVYQAFGPTPSMQLYDRGIRRRLAPMLGNDRKRIELAYSMLMALPSTPVLRYGDEIGMGDNLALKERESVRTPMQWSNSAQGGFSKAVKTVKPLIDTGQYGYHTINVAQQLGDPTSLLNWMKRMIQLRKSLPAIGWGNWKLMDAPPQVLALQYNWEGGSVITLHNFSNQEQLVTMEDHILQNLLTGEETPANVTLKGYGYGWYKLKKGA